MAFKMTRYKIYAHSHGYFIFVNEATKERVYIEEEQFTKEQKTSLKTGIVLGKYCSFKSIPRVGSSFHDFGTDKEVVFH